MDFENAQLIAGVVSSVIFAMGTLNMLLKAWRTKDMRSYSSTMLVLNNIGNIVYWVYVLSLPVGPIYLLHGFYTVATVLMLVWYLMYRHRPETVKRITQTANRIRQTMEIPKLRLDG